MAKIYIKQRQQYFERDGSPLAFGRVTFYDNDTDTPKDIYMSPTESPSNLATNPHRLDAGGFVRDGGVWLGQGMYKAKVERFIGLDSNGSPVFEEYYWEPDIVGAGAESSDILTEVTIDSAITLRTFEAGAYDTVYCLGHTTATDTGGGMFKWDSTSTLADDSGSVFSPIGDPASGRYIRVFNDSKLIPSQFGAFADDNTLTLSGNFGEMETYAQLHPETSHIYIPSGDYYINGSISFSGNITVEMEEGVYFRNNLAGNAVVNVTCDDCIIRGMSQMVSPVSGGPTSTLYYNPVNRDRPAIPDWWGIANYRISTDEYTAMFTGLESPRVINYHLGEYQTFGISLDFSDYTLEFTNDASILLGSSDYTFGTIENNQNTPCLNWDQGVAIPSAMNFSGDSARINYFDVGTPLDSIKYSTLCGILIQDRPFTLLWDTNDYVFSTDVGADRAELSHLITGGKITFNALVDFGRVLSCTTGALDPDSTSAPLLHNGEILIDWFGAIANTSGVASSDNHKAITKAMESAGVSGTLAKFNSNYVTGNGTYYLHEAVDFTAIDSTDFVNLKDFGFWVDASTVPVTKGVRGDFTISMTATDIGLYNVAYRETGSVTHGFEINSDNLEVHNCDMASSADSNWCMRAYCDNGSTNITNSSFRSSNLGYKALDLSNDSVVCNNNTFGPLYSSNTITPTQTGISIVSDHGLSFSNNNFIGLEVAPSPYRLGIVLLSAPEIISVSDNTMSRTGIDIQGTAQGSISGNSWRETTVEINQRNKSITNNTFIQTEDNYCFLLTNGTTGTTLTSQCIIQNNIYHSESIPIVKVEYWQTTGSAVNGTYSLFWRTNDDDKDAFDAGYNYPNGDPR